MLDISDDYTKGASLCSAIGKDPFLSQGAGGNYSWKSEDSLYIKASGMWLSEAQTKNIFVEVNRKKYLNDLKENKFDVDLFKYSQNGLKPSIETSMHALLPQKYVIHLHPVKVLSVLIQNNWQSLIQEKFKNTLISFNLVGYHKPGKDLAEAIDIANNQIPNANLFFLKNHGIIVVENDFESFKNLLSKTLNLFSDEGPTNQDNYLSELEISDIPNYLNFKHPAISKLISEDIFQKTLEQNWRLYPDHLVFMGIRPIFISKFNLADSEKKDSPVIFFEVSKGCYIHENHTKAQLAQLKCYFDVLLSVNDYSSIDSLTESDSLELLNWDAEKYRLSLQK
jgi:rhamnose utilization protein RhaD (predicted bifunctional aldolase and dehydrogenase)